MNDAKQTMGIPGVPGFVLPGVVLAALAVVTYVSFRPPLETSRPGTSTSKILRPPTPVGIDNQFSRLWEDTLALRREASRIGQVDQAGCVVARNQAKLAELKKIADYFESLAFPQTSKPSDRGSTTPKLLCLPVLVPGSPYADDEETRKRSDTLCWPR